MELPKIGDRISHTGGTETTVRGIDDKGVVTDIGTLNLESYEKEWLNLGNPSKATVGLAKDPDATMVKQDAGKLRYDLMPFDALDSVAEILTYGIKKYPKPEENWRVNSKEEDIPRYRAAMLRHYSAIMQGEVRDPESQLPHMAHIATNSLFILALEKKYGVYDENSNSN